MSHAGSTGGGRSVQQLLETSEAAVAAGYAATHILGMLARRITETLDLSDAQREALDDAWGEIADDATLHLVDSGAYAHLDPSAPPQQCVIDTERLREWLAGPWHNSHLSVAESWGVTDSFHCGSGQFLFSTRAILTQAQQAQLFGVPGHHIDLNDIGVDEADGQRLVEYQVILATPSGAVLAAAPRAAEDFAGPDLSGVDTIMFVLGTVATHVDSLLAAGRRLAIGAPAPTSLRRHGFPPIGGPAVGTAPAQPMAAQPSADADRPHR